MKKCLIAVAMVLTFGMNVDAAAQKHRHTARTEQVDSTKNNQDAIEAFSDTATAADAADAEDDRYIRQGRSCSDEDVQGVVSRVLDNADGEDIAGMLFALLVILIIFLLSPIGILIVIFYFINRNRRERYKLAQMAIQNGQPISDEFLKVKKEEHGSDDYQTGIRQMFMGLGLAVFLGFAVGEVGFGIGVLVFFLGLGKWYIARQAGATGGRQRDNDNLDNPNNNQNIKNYE